MNAYDENKDITLIYDTNKNISPESNIPWIVYNGKNYVFKPMILSGYIKANCSEKFNYIVVKHEKGKKNIYIYENGVYILIDDDEFKGFIRKFVPQEMRTKKGIDEVFADLLSDCNFIEEDLLNSNERYINFKDGLLDLKTMELKPHSFKLYSTIQIPANYKEVESTEESSPVFDNYINTLCNGDEETIEVIMECLGLCISNIYGFRTKKALFLVGQGNSGKSQIKSLAENLVGNKNISTVDIKTLNTRFGKMALYNRRLVGCNDMSYETIKDMDVFKQGTGGDKITIEFKGGGFVNHLYKGFFWFNCNKLPAFGGDKGKWVYERMIPIVCDNVIPKDKRDPHLLDKMMKEKNVIIRKSIQALKRLIDKDFKIELTEKMNKTLEKYEIENNTLLTFINECCEKSFSSKYRIKRSTFNECYKKWCKLYNDGKGMLGNNTIKTILKESFGETFKISGGIYYMTQLIITPKVQQELGVYTDNVKDEELFEDFKTEKSLEYIEKEEQEERKKQERKSNNENIAKIMTEAGVPFNFIEDDYFNIKVGE